MEIKRELHAMKRTYTLEEDGYVMRCVCGKRMHIGMEMTVEKVAAAFFEHQKEADKL